MTPSDVVTPETDTAYAMQMASDLGQIANDMAAISRLDDTTDVIGDVCKYGGAIQSATYTDLFLIESTARASVAGTAIPVETLTTGLESCHGKRISMEAFVDYMIALYRAIAAMIARVWAAMASFFKMVLGSIPRMRWSIGRLQKRIKDCGTDWRMAESILLDLPLLSLSKKEKLPKFTSDLITNVDVLNDHVRFYFHDFITMAAHAWGEIVYELERFNEDEPVNTLIALSTAALPIATRNYPPTLKLIHLVGDPRHPSSEWQALPNLLKDTTGFVQAPRIPNSSDPLAHASAIQSCMVVFDTTDPRPDYGTNRTGFIATPSLQELDKLCVLMSNMCDSVVAFNTEYEKIEAYKTRMLQASKDMVERTRELEPSDNDLPYYRAAMRYNTYLTMAVAQPCTKLVSLVMSVNRALLLLGNRAIDSADAAK